MKQIRLSKGLFALVDAQDYEWLMQWKWTASFESRNTKWYAIRWEKKHERKSKKRRKIRMHIALVKHNGGHIPKGFVINHINDNSLDNRMTNFETITQKENMEKSNGWNKQKFKGK